MAIIFYVCIFFGINQHFLTLATATIKILSFRKIMFKQIKISKSFNTNRYDSLFEKTIST